MKLISKKFYIISFLIFIFLASYSCSSVKTSYKFNIKDTKVALVLPNAVNDSIINQAAYNGLKRFAEDYQGNISVVEKVSLADSKQIIKELAERKFDIIIVLGYEYGFIAKKIAKFYPDTFFCVVEGEVSEEPNLCSFNFKDEQYGYLIGSVAGINTSTNKVGIVVSRKTPAIERTILGMRKGLKAINPKVDLVVSYINSQNDINKGREAGVIQINNGVDVITHLADTSGVGVIKAAEDADISVIGAIVDQHDLAPTTVITSGIQDYSQLIYIICELYSEQSLEPKKYRFGLNNQIIDLAQTYGNIDPTSDTRINRIKAKLIDLEASQVAQKEQKEKRKKRKRVK